MGVRTDKRLRDVVNELQSRLDTIHAVVPIIDQLAQYLYAHEADFSPLFFYFAYFLDPDVNLRPLEERQLLRAEFIGVLAMVMTFPEEEGV